MSGDSQPDLVFFDATTNAVWVIQQHLPGALKPINVDMGCGYGPQEWFVAGEEASTLWARPFWGNLAKSFRMYMEEAVSNPSEGVQEVIHHSGRAFLAQDSSFLELHVAENLKSWDPSVLMPWPSDPSAPRLSDRGLLGVHVPSARMKLEIAEKSGFTHAAEVPLNEWSHWVYTRDKNLRTKTYLNGQLVLSAPGADVPYDHRNLILGAAYGRGWHNYYRGSIDEVEVIHRVLTEEEARRRWENRRAATSDWTVCLVSFDGNLDPDGPPRNEVNNALFRSYGNWEYVDGVHGRGIRFDGETGSMRVAADIPEVDVTYSFWFRPEAPVEYGSGQVLVSGYGMYNTNMMLLNTPLNVPRAEPLELFEVKEVEAPEPGRLFLHNAKRFWLGKSFELHLFEDGVWKIIECTGRAPGDEMGRNVMWESDGAIYWLNGANGQIHSLDLNTFTWQKGPRLPASVAASQVAASSQSGRSFANFESGEAWWWPKASHEIYPVEFPLDALAPGDDWSGFSMALGSISFSSRTGVLFPLVVDASKQPLAIAKSGHLWELIRLLFWGAVGFMVLILLKLAKSKRESNAKQTRRKRSKVYSDELLDIVEKLKQCDEVALDSAGLDELLGLADLGSEETRRSHRARWVKDINAWSMMERSRKAILREKDPFDRRRMVYRLDVRD